MPAKSTIHNPGASSVPLLEQHPFLQGMSAHQVKILGDCSRQAHFEPGELMFRAGDPADRFYLIQKGKVALESRTQDKANQLIQNIEAGEVLGWSWMFPPCFWHFDARALESTDAMYIQGKLLREECESDHDLGYELYKRMAEVMLSRLQATRRRLLKFEGNPNLENKKAG
ncbi:cyclic nucleotide-binding domain-containing protein [Pedosphaera parvula]|uniref:Cyclic nucleotide-binding protein n=1 Tax=Pedosphaera parvula (strain Ellin514) TaxID=320771 RepID=B9XBH9_PEDPL|nr:cyclic nucleotide-binding domain-containing protein [Pedosphaera parvula]EEF62864.1 cyclic nucleotide-binding protein [Pedosphaera parvula Ellin514]